MSVRTPGAFSTPFPQDEGEHQGDPYHEPDDDDEEHLAGALESLLSRAQDASVRKVLANSLIF